MTEKLVLGETWTGDLPIFSPDDANLCAIKTSLMARRLVQSGSIHGLNWELTELPSVQYTFR